MDHISRIGVFVAVVDAGGFSGAARTLGITNSAVSKQIQNLETDLKVKLLTRTTRNVAVTEEGALYYERAKRALDDLREAEDEIHELRSHPRGALKISLPHSLGAKYLARPIAEFAALHPDVELDVSLDERFVDLIGEGFDLVLRIGSLEDSTLIARRFAACPFVVCASPDYLARHMPPQTPADLQGHNVLAYTRNTGIHEWRYRAASGEIGRVGLTGTFKSDAGDILCNAAIEGVGMVVLPIFYVAEHLASGRLQRVLPDHETWPRRDIQAVFPPSRHQSARLRLFIDLLAKACGELPWR